MAWFSRGERAARRSELLESAIGPSTSVSGVLKSDGGLRIDGHVEGHIDVAGNIVIGEGAVVRVDTLIGRNITVGGVVTGNIECGGRLEILATGRVEGDIVADAIMIDQGGVFQGVSRMRSAMPALPAPPPAPAAVDDVIIDLGTAAGDAAPVVDAAPAPPPPAAAAPTPPAAPAPPTATVVTPKAAPTGPSPSSTTRPAAPPSPAAAAPPTPSPAPARGRITPPTADAPSRRAEPAEPLRRAEPAEPAPRRAEPALDFALDIEPVIPDTAAGSASGGARRPTAPEPAERRGRRQGGSRRR